MQTKKRSDDACVKRCTLKTGWCGWGSLFKASIPKTAGGAAPRTVSSKGTGMNAGQLLSGRPPMSIGKVIADAQYWKKKTTKHPAQPPRGKNKGRIEALAREE